jgi:hypothetical protein
MTRHGFASLLFALAGCGAREVTHTQPVIPSLLYVDGAGQAIGAATPDSAMVDKVAGTEHVPVVAPDGTPITWGRFRRATGSARMTCEGSATRVHIDAQNLVASGVYTGWLVFFHAPGFLAEQFSAMSGISAIGPPDGSQARFTVDGAGAGTLDALVPAGAVSVPIPGQEQAVPSCLLDAYEVHLVAAYHLDGQTHGGSQGDPDKLAEHVGWMFSQGAAETLAAP